MTNPHHAPPRPLFAAPSRANVTQVVPLRGEPRAARPVDDPAAETWPRSGVEGRFVRRFVPGKTSAELVSLVERTAHGLGAPVALLTLVDDQREFFVATHGLAGGMLRVGHAPAEWAFCRRVCATRASVLIEDACLDPEFRDNPLTQTGVIRSYAAAPVEVEGVIVGAICVVSGEPRTYSLAEVTLLEVVALHIARMLVGQQRSDSGPRPPKRPGDASMLVDGRWQLMAELGHGGQADVFVAREVHSGRDVAVKIGGPAERSVVEEAKAFSSVHHANLVNIHAAGQLEDGREYAVMEYVEGAPFALAMRPGGALDVPTLLDGMMCVAGAVTTLHAAGWVHGDIKPSNILYDRARNRPVLIDLGLGIQLGAPMPRLGGTPGLSAPEQFDPDHGAITRAADVYGVASCVWKVINGSGPFSHLEEADAIVEAQRVGPSLAKPLPASCAAIEAVLRRGLDPNPMERPTSPLGLMLAVRQAARALRDVHVPLEGVHVKAFRVLLAEVESAREDDVRLESLKRRMTGAESYLPVEVFGRLLRFAAEGSLVRLARLARRIARTRGRARLIAARVAFEPWSILEALRAIHGYFLPALRLRTERCSESAARLYFELHPACAVELLAYMHGVVEETLAQGGVAAQIDWLPGPLPTWEARVRWSTAARKRL